jgi:hypothetical protein
MDFLRLRVPRFLTAKKQNWTKSGSLWISASLVVLRQQIAFQLK